MKRLFLFLPLLLLLIGSALHGQAPVIQWQKSLGSFHGDYCSSIEPTADGGYIVAGYTEGKDGDVVGYHGNIILGDLWVIKLSASGDIQWQRCLGGTFQELEGYIRQTPDGGYIVASETSSLDCGIPPNHNPLGSLDLWLIKLSPTGNIQWQNTYGGSGNEYAYSISLTADGGYIVGGSTTSSDGQVTGYHNSGTYGFDLWVIKVDATGNLVWQKALGGSGDGDYCNSVQATADGGCIAAGSTNSSDGDITGNHGKTDAWVIKFSNTGAVQWQKTYGGSNPDVASSIQLTADGGYIFAGSTASNDGDVSGNHQLLGLFDDFWVVKLDAGGSIQWQKCYGGQYNEEAAYLQGTSDGGWVITGQAQSANGDLACNAGLTDAWVIKISSTGALQWGRSMGGDYYDNGVDIKPLPDGSFIVGANTCSVAVPGYHPNTTGNGSCADYWIIKLSAPAATPPAPVVTLSPASAKVCSGSSATFTATIQNTGVHPTYQWTRNGQAVAGNGDSYTASDFQDNDVVKVVIESAQGVCDVGNAEATASITVHINNTILQPTIKITSGSDFLCGCAPATFSATVTGGGSSPSYQWMINGVATGTNSPGWLSNGLLPSDVVTCSYSDSSGCILGGSALSNAISLTPGSGAPSSVSITGPPQTTCSGASITYSATAVNAGPNPVYQWQVNGVDAGTDSSGFTSATLGEGDRVACTITPDPLYPCAVAGSASSSPLVVHLAAKSPPTVDIATPSAQACKGDMVSFTATAKNAGPDPVYQWDVNGAAATATGPVFASNGFADGDIVQCVMTVDPNYFCALSNGASSGTVTLRIIDQPAPSVSIVATPAQACAGSPISFDATVQNAGTAPTYQWLVDGAASGGNNPVFSSSRLDNGAVVVCQILPGAGACNSGAALSNPLAAVVNPLPKILILPGDTTVLAGGQFTLDAQVSGDVVSYQWSPAALLVDPLSLQPTSVALQDSVRYILSAETADGCKSQAGVSVHIYRALLMPNAFSPNGNGVNDLFRIAPGINLQLQEFDIYDRWGERVFSTRNVSQGWDGTVGGHPAAAGVYVYVITGRDIIGPVTAKGTVILVR